MADSVPEKLKAMFAHFFRRRRARHFTWIPAVERRTRHLIVTLMEFGH